ncbi:MAG: sugar nucleotide-binding protein [Burkholderiales bacterium]|nr:sugar nucleotide-binding protein [Burkholderiales bacterium]
MSPITEKTTEATSESVTERTQPLAPMQRPDAPGARGAKGAKGAKAGPVMVIGHTGLLGQALMRVAGERGLRTLGISRRTVPGLNLARQADLAPFLDRLAPSLVINAAAITDLASCEADASAALELHVRLPGLLAEWSRQRGTPWVQVSTDHYWNDIENTLHAEEAPVSPPNTYARTKHAGEELALRNPNCLVLRTNLVGFRGRSGAPTFVEWALAALAAGEPFDAYTDVWASSIEAHQFAHALFDLVKMGTTGLLNLASREAVSKADFIAALAEAAGYDAEHMRRVPRPPRQRPRRANAMGLEVARAEALLGRALPGAAAVIEAIVASPAMPKPSVRIDLSRGTDVPLDLDTPTPMQIGRPDVQLA